MQGVGVPRVAVAVTRAVGLARAFDLAHHTEISVLKSGVLFLVFGGYDEFRIHFQGLDFR